MSPRLRTLSSLLPSSTFINLQPSSREHVCAATFSTTAAVSSGREPNHYEILNVPVTASTTEIKKQFYALSLTHHPDRNRTDPNATSRFANISSAYHVLSNNSKRARYDRDHGIVAHNTSSTHSTATPGQHPMGTHSSHGSSLHNSYVGSRPASGLSKRRGTFQGPPPSFYAHGGYGRTGRTTAGQASSGAAGAGAAAAGAGTRTGGGRGTSTSSEEDPTSFIDRNPIHHFNARSHFRTQSAEDERRQRRRLRALGLDVADREIGGSILLRFLVVCGILVGAGTTAGLFTISSGSGSGGHKSTRRKED